MKPRCAHICGLNALIWCANRLSDSTQYVLKGSVSCVAWHHQMQRLVLTLLLALSLTHCTAHKVHKKSCFPGARTLLLPNPNVYCLAVEISEGTQQLTLLCLSSPALPGYYDPTRSHRFCEPCGYNHFCDGEQQQQQHQRWCRSMLRSFTKYTSSTEMLLQVVHSIAYACFKAVSNCLFTLEALRSCILCH